MADTNSPQWQIEVEYIQSCNCDYGCPCNFNALPTHGNCEALLGYRIRKGKFGDTKLDGVVFAWGLWWPKAIHFGNGRSKLYVDKKATKEQVKAVEQIIGGKVGGGVFAIFPAMCTETFPTEITDIDFHYDPYDAHFSVKGAGEVKSEHITNATTGVKFEGELLLPGGIAFKKGTVTSVDWHWKAADISLKHEKKNGHMSVATFSNEGCLA